MIVKRLRSRSQVTMDPSQSKTPRELKQDTSDITDRGLNSQSSSQIRVNRDGTNSSLLATATTMQLDQCMARMMSTQRPSVWSYDAPIPILPFSHDAESQMSARSSQLNELALAAALRANAAQLLAPPPLFNSTAELFPGVPNAVLNMFGSDARQKEARSVYTQLNQPHSTLSNLGLNLTGSFHPMYRSLAARPPPAYNNADGNRQCNVLGIPGILQDQLLGGSLDRSWSASSRVQMPGRVPIQDLPELDEQLTQSRSVLSPQHLELIAQYFPGLHSSETRTPSTATARMPVETQQDHDDSCDDHKPLSLKQQIRRSPDSCEASQREKTSKNFPSERVSFDLRKACNSPRESYRILKILGSTLRSKTDPFVDVAALPEPQGPGMKRIIRGSDRFFPEELHSMLIDVEREGAYTEAVSFLPHGRAFRVHNKEIFIKHVLPNYFRGKGKWTSFLRQLKLYGFLRVSAGEDCDAYYHELFLKTRPELTEYMRRVGTPKGLDRRTYRPAEGDDPDFYSLPPLVPKPIETSAALPPNHHL